MKKVKRSSFKLNPIAASIVLAMASQFTANVAYGNAGYGVNTNISGTVIAVPTYYANSPQGWQPALDANNFTIINPATGNPYTAAEAVAANGGSIPGNGTVPMINTGTPLRKFVDSIGGVYNGLETYQPLTPTDISAGIPVGLTDQWVDANGVAINGNTDDYYEIAAVEYVEQMHSDLAKQTRVRGYVQVETANMVAKGLKDITGVVPSEHIPGVYPDGTPIYKWKKDPVTGVWAQSTEQVFFVHKPHYLGPTLLAKHGQPIRILFHNYLPYLDANGVSHGSDRGLGGDLTIPVDEVIAGGGPVVNADGTPKLDNNGKPIKFSQNRISIHWHGGDSPWTNDGTPHQWFTPAGDISWSVKDSTHPNGMGVGDSFANVPDMQDPGPGSQTMYFPNNLSGRLMMYHDHASGITKLNAYYGVAAGYLVYDDPTAANGDLQLAAKALNVNLTLPNGTLAGAIPLLDAAGIPLVVQDKVFVPNNIGTTANANPGALSTKGQFQSQDAKWDLAHWGQPGDLYFPHVYETNQDPNSIDGTNPVGRWDWGPWFWPVFPSQYSLPSGNYGDVTSTPEAFVDTPVVNGKAYPTMTLDPKAYRFRILAIGNDRSFNFGFYEAVDGAGKVCDTAVGTPALNPVAPGQTALPATCTEIAMVPASVPTATAVSTATGLPIAAAWPANYPLDGRAGGVPDPTTAGPDIVQIGNEGGLLPAPAIWPAQPVTYDQSVRSMTIYNVLHHQLLMGGGERADILVDFSKYAGKTIILYNDAPAPLPGFDPRIDYFTGVGDQTQGGGAYDTLPGYGPNTRTIMQFKINATIGGVTQGDTTGKAPVALNMAALNAGLPVTYAATQPAPIVPESAYNTVFNPATPYTDNYARIFTGSTTAPDFQWTNPNVVNLGVKDTNTASPTFGKILPGSGINVVAGGSGYATAPIVTITGTGIKGRGGVASGAQATATISAAGVVTGVTVTNLGTGYDPTKPLTVAVTGGTALASQTITPPTLSLSTVNIQSIHVINKAIQELFDPVYGRMNATLAVELPFSSATVATTIPLAYIDAPADDDQNVLNNYDGIDDGETQIWKITHNGVDSHPVHFHLVNVQVINRVDWAGVVKPPEANEIGWKETLRMNPLEDVYVATKAVRPVLPFGVPRSQRVLDPSSAVGSQLGLTQIDQLTGNAPTYQKQITAASPQLVNGKLEWNLPVASTVYSNQLTDFDNEYVWHCHILGHEEFDFMRPFIFHPAMATPDAPQVTAAPTITAGNASGGTATVSWVDPTPFNGQDSNGIPTAGLDATGAKVSSPMNEIGFKVVEVQNYTTSVPGYTVNVLTNTYAPDATLLSSVPSTASVNPTTTTSTKNVVAATSPANSTSWTGVLPTVPASQTNTVPGSTTSTTVIQPVTLNKIVTTTTTPDVTTTSALTFTYGVIAYNSAGDSALGNTGTAVSGNATNTNAVAGATAAAAATTAATNAATAGVAGVATATGANLAVNALGQQICSVDASGNPVACAAGVTTGQLTVAQVAALTAAANNTAANAALAASTAAAGAPVAFAVATPAVTVPGTVALVWANNSANVVPATGYTNVTGYTLSWAGNPAGTTTLPVTAHGVTVEGLTTGNSYTFTLNANAPAPAKNSATVSATGTAQ